MSVKKSSVITVLIFILGSISCLAQEKIVYKKIDSTILNLEVYYPNNMITGSSYPAMVFFFGGGWNGGNPHQFLEHAKYFSQKGIACFLADYRTKSPHGVTPFECLKDAKSAVRFIRLNAKKLNIDPDRIVAAGGSAGGHLAAATASIEDYNDGLDDLKISCIPNALVLFNPVIDNGPGGYGYERIGESYAQFSPVHNIREGMPPTIIFLGTKDKLIPVETMKYFKKVMERVGSYCNLNLYKGKGHGFFNFKFRKQYNKTIHRTEEFLMDQGYIQ